MKADKDNFAYNQRLSTLQRAMGTSWVSLVQARNTLNRAGIRIRWTVSRPAPVPR